MPKGVHLPKTELVCQYCGIKFLAIGSSQLAYQARRFSTKKFCSFVCANEAKRIAVPVLVCQQCRKEFHAPKMKGGAYLRTQKFCSKPCASDAQITGSTDKNGYRVFNSRRNGGYQFEHRLVMEKSLGRKLRSDETVHHKNGDRLDNRLSNLELWSSRHGKGQRVEDKVEFCREFLADYGFIVQPSIITGPELQVLA